MPNRAQSAKLAYIFRLCELSEASQIKTALLIADLNGPTPSVTSAKPVTPTR